MDKATSAAILALDAMMKWSTNFSLQQEDNYYLILNALRAKNVPRLTDDELMAISHKHAKPLDALKDLQTTIRFRCGMDV